jgi:1-acyl-sn-glycerol-3-phosphate acyltransferase
LRGAAAGTIDLVAPRSGELSSGDRRRANRRPDDLLSDGLVGGDATAAAGSRRSRSTRSKSGATAAEVVQFPAHGRQGGEDPQGRQPVDVDPARRSDVDEWGRSEKVRRLARRLGAFYYDKWFRVEWQGLEKIPRSGGALLVANHAGALPADAPMIMHGIEQELGRPVYGLADNWFRTIPAVGTAWSRSGGVPAHPDNAYRILHDEGRLTLVFPEGTKGPSKLVGERYRLRRFGRGGFVESAMRAGVPVVPIAVVGAEEAMPILYRVKGGARLLRVPYLPITANHLVFGPVLGTFAYLPAKFRFQVLDPVTFDVEPGLSKYPRGRVMDEAEAIRQRLQEALYGMLSTRRSIWFG